MTDATPVIVTITMLNKRLNLDITQSQDGERMYSDDFLNALIYDIELMVFGDLKQTYTSSTVPNEVLHAILTLCKIKMQHQLFEDEVVDRAPAYSVIDYWLQILYPMLTAERDDGTYIDAIPIDDYESTT